MARPPSIFVRPLSRADRDWFVETWRTHRLHGVRSRAHAVLLSEKGYTIKQLTDLFEIDEDTARSWINRWETSGRDGLEDRPRSGGPPKLNDEERQLVKQLLEEHPSEPRRVLEELEKRTGKRICRDTLRDLAHRFRLRWKRFRLSLKNLRNPEEFERAREELAELAKMPEVAVAYFDEASFSLTGVVPYGWQPIGQRRPVALSGRRNVVHVLGIEREHGTTKAYLHSGSISAATVVSVIEKFSHTIRKTTVLVVDNAKPHTGHLFREHEAAWAERGLIIYPLPKYSPELNHIEHLWRRVKYSELPAEAYRSLQALIDGLVAVFRRLGKVELMPSVQTS